MHAAVEVDRLAKSYGSHVALRGITFQVERGEVVGFLGPNGAGKSTCMKIVTGFLAPSAGSTRIEGHDVLEKPIEARSPVGYLPENAPIYPDMIIHDYLDYVGRIRGLGRAERHTAITTTADRCGITDRLGQRVGALSKGYRQRVGLAQAMLHSPSILILDEPTTGLDPNQIVEIRNLIREIGRSKTIILSTHILSEVQATCDRVLIIHRGEIVADGKTDDVTTHTQGGQLLRATYAPGKVSPQRETVLSGLSAIAGIDRVRALQAENPAHMTFEILAREDVREALFRYAVEQGLILIESSRAQSNLEEVFRRLTMGEMPSSEGGVAPDVASSTPADV
jgi:ABC-2 type transport system ATP-binding protein